MASDNFGVLSELVLIYNAKHIHGDDNKTILSHCAVFTTSTVFGADIAEHFESCENESAGAVF